MMIVALSYARWFEAIERRKSRRSFEQRHIDQADNKRLKELCNGFSPYPDVRAVFRTDSPDEVFKGAIGHYGMIKGAPAFIAFIGDRKSLYVNERIGYLGEGIILEATSLGLDTCWVGGFFRPEVAANLVGTYRGERVLAVTPVGYAKNNISLEERIMTGFGRTHRRKPLSDLVSGLDESKWPTWIQKSLEAARLAPSAVNRQPWRFEVAEQSITVSVDNQKDKYGISKRLDCGIAMLHIELGAMISGVSGKWEFLVPPKVARFIINPNIVGGVMMGQVKQLL
ncbi:MAG: nitroreductase family protein [Desulfotomaculaceae bacterium]|nr:nitroreductase family protein [Desulfotomaculaceae bacterium]